MSSGCTRPLTSMDLWPMLDTSTMITGTQDICQLRVSLWFGTHTPWNAFSLGLEPRLRLPCPPRPRCLAVGTARDTSLDLCTVLCSPPWSYVGTNWVQQSLYILFPALPHRADLFSDEWHCRHTVWVSPSHRSSLLQSSKMPSGARIILSICTHFSRLLTHRQDFQAPEVGLPPKILHRRGKSRWKCSNRLKRNAPSTTAAL